ncbi:MAG: sulfatase-like hydrolase/transferase [Deltaproteobacteria bacterium]|nr:sulfatase-like hydrolase/transferase [Deltaproteobacteria bacterium]
MSLDRSFDDRASLMVPPRRHVAVLLPLLGLLACSPAPTPRHLVAIVVDTRRADALGLYGNPRGTSPKLDSFARESVIFEHAWAQGTYTLASYLSYMSSIHVRSHGWDFPFLYNPKAGVCGWDDMEMLAEVLARNGFRNEAFVANPVLEPSKGFARGFHDWNGIRLDGVHEDDTSLWLQFWLDDGRVVEEAEAALARWEGDRRQFLYLHLMDPHPPLDPSPAGREAVGAPADWAPGGRLGSHWVRELRKRGTPEQKERVRDGYLASVWDADDSVGRILRAVEESGHADDTVVVFFADHGEQIWEHGDHGHARGVWEELAHVPLLIRIPGRPPERVDRPVGLLDLAPTLLKALGIEEFPASWQGRNLFEADGRVVVSQRLRQTAVTVEGRIKGILGIWPGGIGWRYFDLEGDPGEQEALANVEGAGKLRKCYERWAAGVPKVARDRGEQPVGICVMTSERHDRLHEDALRALGYIQ